MSMRKYKRSIIRAQCIKRDGNAKAFHEEWKKFHDAEVKARTEQKQKNEEITVTRNKPVTAKRHHDNGRVWLRQLRAMKAYIEDLRKQATKKKAEQLDKVSE